MPNSGVLTTIGPLDVDLATGASTAIGSTGVNGLRGLTAFTLKGARQFAALKW